MKLKPYTKNNMKELNTLVILLQNAIQIAPKLTNEMLELLEIALAEKIDDLGWISQEDINPEEMTSAELWQHTLNQINKKKFAMISPDGIPTLFGNLKKINADFKNWIKGYEVQGYYSSVDYGRIQPNEIINYCQLTVTK